MHTVPALVKTEPTADLGCAVCGALPAHEQKPLGYFLGLLVRMYDPDATEANRTHLRRRMMEVPADCEAVLVCSLCGCARGYLA